MRNKFTVASANLHGSIDAWGRRFDAHEALVALDADIYFLQECWTNDTDPSFAGLLAEAINGHVVDVPMATGRRAQPKDNARSTWHRRKSFLDGDDGLYLESERSLTKNLRDSPRYLAGDPGTLSLALVSRFAISNSHVVGLRNLRKDRARRSFLVATLDLDGVAVNVIATHMTHLTYGSPFHFRSLRSTIRHLPHGPIVLGGDMNLWGPGVTVQLPKIRRAVKGKTWPSWGPHSQLDHLMINDDLEVLSSGVSPSIGSDHLPVVATLALRS